MSIDSDGVHVGPPEGLALTLVMPHLGTAKNSIGIVL